MIPRYYLCLHQGQRWVLPQQLWGKIISVTVYITVSRLWVGFPDKSSSNSTDAALLLIGTWYKYIFELPATSSPPQSSPNSSRIPSSSSSSSSMAYYGLTNPSELRDFMASPLAQLYTESLTSKAIIPLISYETRYLWRCKMVSHITLIIHPTILGLFSSTYDRSPTGWGF